jgi:branched-chain amino acid transport system permease protein
MSILKKYGVWVFAALVMLIVPHIFTSSFALNLLSQMGVLIIFSLAYNMLLGQGGMLSFGHAIYFGLAGYFTIHYLNFVYEDIAPYFPITFFPLIGGLVGLFFGVVIGYVSTRRAGTTFAMISLGFGEMVTALTLILVAVFNGEDGIQTDRYVGPETFGITFIPGIEVYYLIAAWVLISAAAMYALTKTPFGRMSNAVRDNPERTEFVGYSSQRIRWLAFSLSSFFAGLAGSLHAINFELIGFETVSAIQSGGVLFMAYIGGIGHFAGPIIGAILITFLQGTLTSVTEAWVLYLGILFVAVIMYFPGGLSGLILMHQPIWRVDSRLLLPLLMPYFLFLTSLVVALIGFIGLIEVIYIQTSDIGMSSHASVFGIPVDPSGFLPWLVFGAIAVAGVFAVRATYPRASGAWNEAINKMRARIG